MKGLTDKQQEILDYIENFLNTKGMAPTVYEIADQALLISEHCNVKVT